MKIFSEAEYPLVQMNFKLDASGFHQIQVTNEEVNLG